MGMKVIVALVIAIPSGHAFVLLPLQNTNPTPSSCQQPQNDDGAFSKSNPSLHVLRTARIQSSSTESTTGTPKQQQQQQQVDDEIVAMTYTLPEPDRELSHLELEFRSMVESFACYTKHDFLAVKDSSLASVYKGVAACAREPAAYRAFEVLFQDLGPLRLGGRMVYKRLKKVMNEARERRKNQVAKVAKEIGLSEREVEASHEAFLSFAVVEKNEFIWTTREFVDSGIADKAGKVLGYENAEELLLRLDQNKRGKLTFEELMVGLQRCAEEMCKLEQCNPAEVVQELAQDMRPRETGPPKVLTARQQKFSNQFDHMVETFKGYEDYVPSGDGRRLEVLRGCFVGAKNREVVNALKVVYVDYPPLRLAGDIIFKLMTALVSSGRKRQRQTD